MATQLTDLEVDRVDAVERPATRRKFLILKDEAGDQKAAAGEAQKLLTAATKAMTTLRKADGVALPADAVTALNEFVDALGDEKIEKFAAAAASTKQARKQVTDIATAKSLLTRAQAALPATGAIPEEFAEALDELQEALGTTAASKSAPFDEDSLASKIAKSIVEGLREAAKAESGEDEDDATGKIERTAPASTQPAGQTAVTKSGPRKMGDGLFSNIVLGR